MVCIQLIADDLAVAFRRVARQLPAQCDATHVINNFLHTAPILGDASSAPTRRRPSPATPTALDCGAIGAEDVDRIVNPTNMVGPF
jgi:hypothetical protein